MSSTLILIDSQVVTLTLHPNGIILYTKCVNYKYPFGKHFGFVTCSQTNFLFLASTNGDPAVIVAGAIRKNF